MNSIAYVGLDVHKATVLVAVAEGDRLNIVRAIAGLSRSRTVSPLIHRAIMQKLIALDIV